MAAVTAFVLAGGRSSRMGSDKALLSFAGQTLLERALSVSASVASKVCIVGAEERYAAFGDVVEDIHEGCGPLGGIHAALSATGTELNLMLSVDMPLMSSQFLAWLLEQASGATEWIVVPDALGLPQPLCAVYRREVRAVAERALQRGDYKVGRLFSEVPTRYVRENEIGAAGFSTDVFKNANTVDEFDELRREYPENSGAKRN